MENQIAHVTKTYDEIYRASLSVQLALFPKITWRTSFLSYYDILKVARNSKIRKILAISEGMKVIGLRNCGSWKPSFSIVNRVKTMFNSV